MLVSFKRSGLERVVVTVLRLIFSTVQATGGDVFSVTHKNRGAKVWWRAWNPDREWPGRKTLLPIFYVKQLLKVIGSGM